MAKPSASPLVCLLVAAGLPEPTPEFRFHPTRKWRLDLAWAPQLIALEVEGGVYQRGRHTRGKGYEKDIEKYNAAALLGWIVIRASTNQVESGQALVWLLDAFKLRKGD